MSSVLHSDALLLFGDVAIFSFLVRGLIFPGSSHALFSSGADAGGRIEIKPDLPTRNFFSYALGSILIIIFLAYSVI